MLRSLHVTVEVESMIGMKLGSVLLFYGIRPASPRGSGHELKFDDIIRVNWQVDVPLTTHGTSKSEFTSVVSSLCPPTSRTGVPKGH